MQQFVRRAVVQVHPLHQQRPVRLVQRRQRAPGERPALQPPGAALALDQARLDLVARGQREQLRAGQQRAKSGNRVADQQGLLLPVSLHELRGGEAT
jgi:hypothetical protein